MNPILPFTALARTLRSTGCMLLLALCAGSCTTDDMLHTAPADSGNADADALIRFDIAPRPGFCEVNADGTPADPPRTRIVQTPDAAQWEDGDIIWLRADFYNANDVLKVTYISALKRDNDQWRSLNYVEEKDYIKPCKPLFGYYKKEIRWPESLSGESGIYCKLWVRYLGQQYPGTSGKIEVTHDINMIDISDSKGYITIHPGETAELRFCQSQTRLRITNKCRLEFTDVEYKFDLPGFGGTIASRSYDLDVPPGGQDYFFITYYYGYSVTINGRNIKLLPNAQGSFSGMSYTIDPEKLPNTGPVVPEF